MKGEKTTKMQLNKITVANLSYEKMGRVMGGDLNTLTSERCESVWHCTSEWCGSGQTGSQDFCNMID